GARAFVEGRRGGLSAVRGVSNSNDPDNSDFRGGASELALDLSPAEGGREMLKGVVSPQHSLRGRWHALSSDQLPLLDLSPNDGVSFVACGSPEAQASTQIAGGVWVA